MVLLLAQGYQLCGMRDKSGGLAALLGIIPYLLLTMICNSQDIERHFDNYSRKSAEDHGFLYTFAFGLFLGITGKPDRVLSADFEERMFGQAVQGSFPLISSNEV